MKCFQKKTIWWGWRQTGRHHWCFLPVRVAILSLCYCFTIIFLMLHTGNDPCKLNFHQLATSTTISAADNWQMASDCTGQLYDFSGLFDLLVSFILLLLLPQACVCFSFERLGLRVITTVDLWKHLSSSLLLNYSPYPRLIVSLHEHKPSALLGSALCYCWRKHIPHLPTDIKRNAGPLKHVLRFCISKKLWAFIELCWSFTECY